MMSAQEFYDALATDVLENTTGLNTELYQALRRYYRTLADNPERREFHRYSWIRRTEPMVRLLNSLPVCDVSWRVLDAGCGLGTESIFWSTLRDDIQVLGIDLSARRLGVAQARCSACERHLGKALSVHFLEQDVFGVLNSEGFIVVWTMEAISHIDPAERFLSDVAKNLGDRGHLVVSDSHIWNPAMAWHVLKLRRRGVTLRTHKTTSRGQTVSYAQERLLTVGWLSRTLKEAGFASVQTQLSVSFPPNLAVSPSLLSACILFDRVMNRVPVARNIGGIYTLAASK